MAVATAGSDSARRRAPILSDVHSRAPVVIAGVVALVGLAFSSVSTPRRFLLALAVFLFLWLVLQAVFDNVGARRGR